MANAPELKLILKPTNALPISVRTTGTYTSTGLDVTSFESVYLHFYSNTNINAVGNFRLQTSDVFDSGYTTVDGSIVPLANGFDGLPNVIYRYRTGPLKRYVRSLLSITSGTPACGVFLYLYDPLVQADQDVAYPN